MRNTVAALLLTLALVQPAPAQTEVEIVTSELYTLYYLVECLIDEPHRSPDMAANFRGRVGNWTPLEQALNTWKEHRESPDLSTLRLPKVDGGFHPGLSYVLERVMLSSKDARDAAERTRPWIGPHHSQALEQVLDTVGPTFKSYWWSPAQEQLHQKVESLKKQLQAGGFKKGMEAASRFYNAQLPPGEKPTLVLVPRLLQPGQEKVATRGHNSGTVQVMEVLVERPDKDRAGVVFHEFMHALWKNQNPEETRRWKERFADHGGWGRAAYVQLNEGLATALGNGWFSGRVNGELDSGSWYNDPVIDAYGHALLPVIEPALAEGRPPTDAELDRMVEVFQEALPEALSDFNVVAAEFMTISSHQEIQSGRFQNEVMRLGPVRSSHTRDWDEGEKKPCSFTVFWLKPDERNRLDQNWPNGWQRYYLRQGAHGWELAFIGKFEELFELLCRFQSEGLSPGGE